MPNPVYARLARHLDRLPDGFPPSRTGAELRLLETLFTPAQAELALHLTLEPEPAAQIAARAGLDAQETAARLAEMADKGLIFARRGADGAWLYQAAPMFVGIYEWQVNNLRPDVLAAFADHWSTQTDREQPPSIPQVRTVPVGESIDKHLQAMTYEQVNALVQAQTRFAVAPCICRLHTRLASGRDCGAPKETCLMLGDWADFYARSGRGRAISREEVLSILTQAEASNLVIQPSNSRELSFICCCCGCCCGVLADLKRHPRPADVVASAFIAALDVEACSGCFTCLERCQMEALREDLRRAAFLPERCIGCGLCVTTCPSGALTLQRKPAGPLTTVPATMDENWRIKARDRAG